ncbi:UDP-glucose dehydrogenase family protein [Lichenihabitans psoromatis]|uniref:UDP-glucose dehydrogenase family protein n=1 Tax=Lichenihabitans psoromatis TaxID=2528642 RepID=UPI001AEC749B|nr:UDP-glucose/GDP-mannose dehydrogenase family protein [Lichenihabitans psoromatis]
MMKVCVVGTGYVGLVSGTCLAEIGHDVICVDSDSRKIDLLRDGRIPIYEPGLENLVVSNAAAHRLHFTTDLASAMTSPSLVLMIAVGTPTGRDGATAELGPLLAAVESAARSRRSSGLRGFVAFVIKSTVPVGTNRTIEAVIARHLSSDEFAVVSNPEFLREGSAVGDFMEPDRIVVGSRSAEALTMMRDLFAPLTRRGSRLFEVSSVETSELIKYASNIFLATKIGLINEFSRLCERSGADVEELAVGIGLDQRIGMAGLRAGPGFGGSCFPKDLRALVGLAASMAMAMPIAEAVIASNERQKRFTSEKIIAFFGGDVRQLRIGVLGLSFKAGTDDTRESPALSMIGDLIDAGADVAVHDPSGSHDQYRHLAGLTCAESAGQAVAGADAIVVATEWPEFRALDWEALALQMNRPVVFDLRNCLDGPALARFGLEHVGLGRLAAPSAEGGDDARHGGHVAGLGDHPGVRELNSVAA